MEVFLFIFIFTIFLFFFKIKWGICAYVLLLFLVPVIPPPLKWSYVNVFLFLALFLHAYQRQIKILYKPLSYFLYFYLFLLVLCVFETGVSIDYQISTGIGNVLRFAVLPIAMLTVYTESNRGFESVTVLVFICIFISTAYAIFLTRYPGENPYITWTNLVDVEEWEKWLNDSTRLFGRISSVFSHPMTFGCFIVNAFFYCLYKYLNSSNLNYCSLIGLILLTISAVICGVRSVLVALFIGLIVFLLYNRKLKFYVWTFLLIILLGLFVSNNEILGDYLSSILNTSTVKTLEGGSSMEMRIRQLEGCFDIISSNVFFGKGYGWTAFYNDLYGDHPVCRAFESYIFVLLCNWGLVGLFGWFVFIVKIFKFFNSVHRKGYDKYGILVCLAASHVGYICVTGDYAYTVFWTFFTTLILLDIRIKKC